MACNQKQKRNLYRRGLMQTVEATITELFGIDKILYGNVQRYQGERKVKIPEKVPLRCVPIFVCDPDHGEVPLSVFTAKPGAIARILRRELKKEGVCVC